jgi:hypothetical protein
VFLTFNNTVLLIGFAGAVVPLVLHLLSRARYQSVSWGAMLFLEGIENRQQYNNRLNQIVLLVIRMALVALLAVALAEPVLQRWGPDANAGLVALRAANRGELLCLAGTIGSAAAAVGAVVAAIASTPESGFRRRRVVLLLLAVSLGLGAVWLGRRTAAWDTEVESLMAQQPQSAGTTVNNVGLRARVDAAILLDCSSSMDFEENGHTRFSLAQGAARQLLAGMRNGDRVSLVLMGHAQPDAELEPTADLQSVADRIDAAHTAHASADVADGLIRAQDALVRAGATAHDIYVVCDRQATSWRGVNDYFITQRWPHLLKQSTAASRIFVVPVGDTDTENVAVENIELRSPPAIVGQPAEAVVDLYNYGSAPRSSVPLSVSFNGHPIFETTVSVAAGKAAHVAVPIKAGDVSLAGPQIVSADIRTTGYRDDDHLESIVEAIDPIRVLVLSGDQTDGASDQFRNESDFLRLALAPLQTLHRKGADPCKVDVVSAERWSDVELTHYQVVVLANVERFGAAQARTIEQYVYGGGGLLIAPGNLARIDNYDEQLWRDGAGILPAELEDATPADGSQATTIVGFEPTTPVFEFLHDQPDLMLSSTIGRYFPTNPRPSDAHVLAWYTSGAPFLIQSQGGRGKVLLMTTSLDADWSTLPLSSFYLPFVQSAVRYLAAGTLPSRNLSAGEPIQATFDDSLDDRAVVDVPDGEPRQVAMTRYGSTSELLFPDTAEPGIYRVHVKDRLGEPHTLAFAVHVPHDESDLTQITDARWDELERRLQIRQIDPGDRGLASVVAGSREGYELWPWALAGLLCMGAVELALARQWSKDAF